MSDDPEAKSGIPNWQKLAAELEAAAGGEDSAPPQPVHERPKASRHLTLVPPKDGGEGKKR